MSGLCLSSFILALVLALLAFLTLWPGVLLPLALAILALTTVDPARRRGRAFAWWALVISLGSGAFGYLGTHASHLVAEHVGGSVLAALGASGSDEERDRLLDPWLAPDATPETRERIQTRYAQAVERYGRRTGELGLPTLWAGSLPLFLNPAGVVPLDDPQAKDGLPPQGMALWVRVPFERGTLRLALVMGTRDPQSLQTAMQRLGAESEDLTRPARVLRDARFFVQDGR